MNLLLFRRDEISTAIGNVILRDPTRLTHVKSVLKLKVGDTLRVGILGGDLGMGTLLALASDHAEIQVNVDTPPSPKLPIHLIVALPRPKTFRKVLWGAVTLGVSHLTFIQSARTDKAYWQSAFLTPKNLESELILALEQAGDTQLPQVDFFQRFRPFAEDVLPLWTPNQKCFLAHVSDALPCPTNVSDPIVLAIGPEGGWVPFEVELFQKSGFQMVSFGQRILRVEEATLAFLGRLARLD